MWVELVTPRPGVAVLRVDVNDQGHDGWMPIASACAEGTCWRVRALLGYHEEVVDSDAAMRQCLLEDFHEVFPGVELVQLREVAA
jgi:hypothetical protein